MVGRQIVDRAKIQRIIFEFDYYEKAFYQFYDTYRVVPGSMSEKTCEKYSVFKNYYISRNIRNGSQTGCKCCTTYGGTLDKKLIHGWKNLMYVPKRQLVASGLLEGSFELTRQACNQENIEVNLIHSWLYGSSASFEATIGKEHRLAFTGFDFQRMLASGETMEHFLQMGIPGSNKYFNSQLPHEIENETFKQAINRHNVLIYYHFREDVNSTNSMSGKNVAEKNTWSGVLNSKLASQLDSKLDDGRPGTGTILAMKSGFGHGSGATEEEHKAVCYDKRADEVDKAIYQSDTNMKYGCNMMYVLEGLK